MLRLYKLVLLLYPSAHRQEFAEEMLSVFRQVHLDCACLGFKARIRFSSREIAGLLAGAFREHTRVRKANLTGGAMRMFRFPRWTVTLLVLALVIVLAGMGIIKTLADLAEIRARVAMQTLPPGVSISTPLWRIFFPEVLQVAAGIMCVLGLLGFVLRAALGRTGSQRLPLAKTWPAQDARKR